MEKAVVEVEDTTKKNKEQSYWGLVFSYLWKNKMAMGALFLLTIIVLACLIIPEVSPHDIVTTNPANGNMPPDNVHLLGTDDLGRDMFVRFFYAGRISMSIALMVTFFTCLIGVILGAVSGFYGGFLDSVIMRLSEVFYSLPFLLTCIVLAAFFGSGIYILTVALTLLSWPSICRIVRGQILALRDQEYMQACEALGISDIRRIFRHLMPNVLAYVVVYATLEMASVILTETALSFLGLGISPPTPSWGTMINEARQTVVLAGRWWFWIPPGIAIFVAVLCFNLIGDGLRDAIDPKMKR